MKKIRNWKIWNWFKSTIMWFKQLINNNMPNRITLNHNRWVVQNRLPESKSGKAEIEDNSSIEEEKSNDDRSQKTPEFVSEDSVRIDFRFLVEQQIYGLASSMFDFSEYRNMSKIRSDLAKACFHDLENDSIKEEEIAKKIKDDILENPDNDIPQELEEYIKQTARRALDLRQRSKNTPRESIFAFPEVNASFDPEFHENIDEDKVEDGQVIDLIIAPVFHLRDPQTNNLSVIVKAIVRVKPLNSCTV